MKRDPVWSTGGAGMALLPPGNALIVVFTLLVFQTVFRGSQDDHSWKTPPRMLSPTLSVPQI